MSLVSDIDMLLEAWKNPEAKAYREESQRYANICEGDLEGEVINHLKRHFPKTWNQMIDRIAPINVLKRLVDKLSKIYQQNPMRTPTNNDEGSKALLGWYVEQMRPNTYFNMANEYFNGPKSCLLEPYFVNGLPRMRVIDPSNFTVVSQDPWDPTNPTHTMVQLGKIDDVATFYAATSDEILIFNEKKEVLRERMAQVNNLDGINPLGRLPYTYVRRSRTRLIPKHDSDMLQMAILLAVLLSDLNFAVKFQCFSIIYGIDLDLSKITLSPNSVLTLKSDKTTDKKPEIGQIKPEVDIPQVLSLIQAELSLWLQTRGIRPGSVGQLTADSFASGISKMIDEMDTSENRQMQVEYFRDFEADFWDLTFARHNVYAGVTVANSAKWTGGMINTEFREQLPMVKRSEVVQAQKIEFESGFTTLRRALQKINPTYTPEEIDQLIKEIQEEKAERLAVAQQAFGQGEEEEGEEASA